MAIMPASATKADVFRSFNNGRGYFRPRTGSLRDPFRQIRSRLNKAGIKVINIRSIDLRGDMRQVSIMPEGLADAFKYGVGLDGSSYGFLGINRSDLLAKVDPGAIITRHPFAQYPTANVFAHLINTDGSSFLLDPRGIALAAEKYCARVMMKVLGKKGTIYFLPELEFHLKSKDEVIDPAWLKQKETSAYHACIQNLHADAVAEMALIMRNLGIKIRYFHAENGALPGTTVRQEEIEPLPHPLLEMADYTALMKEVILGVADRYNLEANFEPKPYGPEHSGSGMHIQMRLGNDKESFFYDPKEPDSLNDRGLSFMGGLLTFPELLFPFTNAAPQSFDRLGSYEAPSFSLGWGREDRSALIRIPGSIGNRPKYQRFEIRCSDLTANPHLVFAILTMLGCYGLEHPAAAEPAWRRPGNTKIEGFDSYEDSQATLKKFIDSDDRSGEILEYISPVIPRDLFEAWLAREKMDFKVDRFVCSESESSD